MKLEVGMYVRYKGTIKKIESIHKNCEGYKTEISLTKTYPRLQDYEIKKASFNIIDLIEVGDILEYKDGKVLKIKGIDKKLNPPYYLIDDCIDNVWERQEWIENDLKEVLTHEQYEANCYKVVE